MRYAFALGLLLLASPVTGQQASSDRLRPVVVDLSAAWSSVSGEDDWRSYDAVVTWARPKGTAYLFLNRSERLSGRGSFAAAGWLRDWAPRLFTYTSIGAGTGDAPHVPRLRTDLDVNVKLLASRRLVAIAGATTVRYQEQRRDDIVSAGLSLYGPVVATYRYFHNASYPGAIGSSSQLLQVSFERRGEQAAFLRHSWGSEAYLPSIIISPEAVRTRGRSTTLSYRHWLSEAGGFISEVERQTKGDSFRRTAVRAGIFFQF